MLSDDASIRYGGLVHDAIRAVREDIATLGDPRIKHPSLPGSLRALRALLEADDSPDHARIAEGELLAWLETVEAWRKKKRKHDPRTRTIEGDLQALRAFAAMQPEREWQRAALERRVAVTIKDQATIDAALSTAERDHPVRLGNALHEHLVMIVSALAAKSPSR